MKVKYMLIMATIVVAVTIGMAIHGVKQKVASSQAHSQEITPHVK